MQKRIFPSAYPECIHRPRYENFSFGTDSAAWTIGMDNSDYFAVFLIPYIYYTVVTFDLLHFNNEGTRYLRND
jgi:hypothetical protein